MASNPSSKNQCLGAWTIHQMVQSGLAARSPESTWRPATTASMTCIY